MLKEQSDLWGCKQCDFRQHLASSYGQKSSVYKKLRMYHLNHPGLIELLTTIHSNIHRPPQLTKKSFHAKVNIKQNGFRR